MRHVFDSTADLAAADRISDPVDVVGRCRARNCPNIWTTQSTTLCRWHSAAPESEWPRISDELQRVVSERAMGLGFKPRIAPVTLEDKREILGNLQALFRDQKQRDPKGWAFALRDREQGGERLSSTQRSAWRIALGEGSEFLAPDHDERTQRLKAESARQVEAYARRNGISLPPEPIAPTPAFPSQTAA